MSTQQLETVVATGEQTPQPKAAKSERLLSLDVFRGFTLLSMVLVNSHPGPIYPPIAHASWHGWTFTDLIFPFFVFIVGVAIPYSFANRLARGDSKGQLFWHITKRCVLLFVVGMLLNGYPHIDFATIRIMNVLQRIAICYFFASILYAYLRISVRSMLWMSGTILVGYFLLMKFVPVPGHGAGLLEPTTNWSNYIDRHILAGHMQTPVKEPKSVLGNFPALVTMLMGLLTGLHLRTAKPVFEKLTNIYFWGSMAMAAGAVWSIWFPINQKLWTSSLVLLMGGMAMVFLATCYYIVDIKKVTWWTLPCLIYGMNSVAVWIFSQLGMKTLMNLHTTDSAGATITLWKAGGNVLASYLGDYNGSLAFAVLYDLFWLGFMGLLYWRRIFIRF